MARSKRKKGRGGPGSNDLNLHGEKHKDVDRLVENHIFMNSYPHKIITGNSGEMHKLAKAVLDRHGFRYEIGDINNKGFLNVLGY